jgi:hypothetical protein
VRVAALSLLARQRGRVFITFFAMYLVAQNEKEEEEGRTYYN